MKLNWNFQRGGGGSYGKIPSVGEVWIISGSTQCHIRRNSHMKQTGVYIEHFEKNTKTRPIVGIA